MRKKRLSYIALVLGLTLLVALIWAACFPSQEAMPPPKIPLQKGATLSPPTSLTCWEQTSSGRLESGKINTIRGLAADGDLLWIATDRGLARLDLRTWTCDLFTEAAGASLAGTIILLPDGNGGLWIGEPFRHGEHDADLVFYSEGAWQGTRLSWESIGALALNQAGQIWAGGMAGKRTPAQMCSKGSTFPPLDWDWENANPYPYDPLLDCKLWQRMSWGGTLRYTSPAECELANGLDPERRYWPVLANGDEMWFMDRYPPDGVGAHLLHQKGDAVEELSGSFSRYGVKALAPDPVRGGLWIGTSEGLMYAKSTATGGYVFQPIPLLLGGTSAQGDRYVSVSQSFPGEAAGLAVEAEGQVWAVNGESLLRYDEDDWEWQQVFSDTRSVDAIAADPVRGVLVTGPENLLHIDGMHVLRWSLPDDFRGAPTALLVDRDRRVWVGTTRDGVWTATPLSRPTDRALNWHRFGREDGLESTLITALAQAPDDRIYAAHHAGVSVLDPADGVEDGRWTTLPDSDVGEENVWANVLAFGQGGDELWVGYYPGMTVRRYRHADGQWADYPLPIDLYQWTPLYGLQECSQPDPLPRGGISALLVDNSDALWVGVTGDEWWYQTLDAWRSDQGCWPSPGLFRWQAAGEGDPHWQALDLDGGSAPLGVLSLTQDTQGRIWAGGGEPVAVWEGDQ